MWLLCLLSLSLSPMLGCEPTRGPMHQWMLDHSHIATTPTLESRNTHLLPSKTQDQAGQPSDIAGLSGITYLGPEDASELRSGRDNPAAFEQTWHRFAAIADGETANVVFLRVRFNPEAIIREVQVTGSTRLQHRTDFEGISSKPVPGGQVDWVWLSDEYRKNPGIHRYDLSSGSRLETLEMPDVLRKRSRVAGSRRSTYPVRPNRGLEALTQNSHGTELWTATEVALVPDGPAATDEHGTTVRLMRFAKLCDEAILPAGQYAYQVDPIHGPLTTRATSGLVELLITPQGHMLALERSAVESLNPFQHRLYLVDFRHADDVTRWTDGLAAEGARPYAPVDKTLIWQTSWVTSPGNMEGLCVGPELPSGNHVLLGVVDDGDPISGNVIVSFELGIERVGPAMAVK